MTALWADLDAIRRKNIPGATACLLTDGRRKHLRARMDEHGADALRAMVEWLTGCRCGACHACKWMQPKGYTGADTYLRPDNCAKYTEAAREHMPAPGSPEPSEPDRVDWGESDACRAIAERCLWTGEDIQPKDEREWFLTRRTLRVIGGRPTWRGKTNTPEWVAAWRAEWPASVAAEAERKVGAK